MEKNIYYIFLLIIGFLLGVIFQNQCFYYNKENFDNSLDLNKIHNKIVLMHGSLQEEYTEQLL